MITKYKYDSNYSNSMKTTFIVIMTLLFLIPFVSSAEIPHKLDTNLEFSMTSNNASVCILTTMNAPTSVIFLNLTGEKQSQTFNWTILADNFTKTGTYVFNIECSDGISIISGSITREVTPNGITSTTGNSIFYALLLVFLTVIFLFSFDRLFKSSNGQWFITFAISCYFTLLMIIFTLWKFTENYMFELEWLVSLFSILFIVVLILMFPFIIGLFIYLFFDIFNEKHMRGLTAMGYSREEARNYRR